MPVPRDRLDWMREGEVFFLEHLAALSDEELRSPSALPGWSRAHVVSHFSRNARALMNLLDWARHGCRDADVSLCRGVCRGHRGGLASDG